MNHPKVAKAFGQIARGNAGAITIEPDKEAIILGSHSDGADSAGGANAQYVATDHHGEQSGHGTSLQLGKKKEYFLQEV